MVFWLSWRILSIWLMIAILFSNLQRRVFFFIIICFPIWLRMSIPNNHQIFTVYYCCVQKCLHQFLQAHQWFPPRLYYLWVTETLESAAKAEKTSPGEMEVLTALIHMVNLWWVLVWAIPHIQGYNLNTPLKIVSLLENQLLLLDSLVKISCF